MDKEQIELGKTLDNHQNGTVDITISSMGLLSYPLTQARRPIIEKITLTNLSDHVIENFSLIVSSVFDYISIGQRNVPNRLEANESISFEPEIHLEGKKLFSITEILHDQIHMYMKDQDGNELGSASLDMAVLPMNQWTGIDCMPETLAAFVMPNIPKIIELQHRATQLLKEATGESSFSGYQREDKNFVRAQMAAIFGAIYEQRIAYVNPPASFGPAQRVRTTEEVLSSKMGTCIEMAVLFSALAEACGLNPFIVLIPGHAFAGVWLKDEMFTENVIYDGTELTKRASQGIHDVEIIECTDLNGDKKHDFEQAVRVAHGHLEEPIDAIIDIKRTHYSLLKPMPILSIQNGEINLTDYGLADDAEEKAVTTKTVEEYYLDLNSSQVVDKSTIWMRNMLDISKRNALVSFKPGPKNIQLMGASLGALEDELAKGRSLELKSVTSDWTGSKNSTTVIDVTTQKEFVSRINLADYKAGQIHTFLESDPLKTRLTTLFREAKKNTEETGANSLYLALGLLRWYDKYDKVDADGALLPRYSPLVLLPIEMIRNNSESYSIRLLEDEPQFNITLIEMLRQRFEISLQGLNPLPTDQSGIDLDLVFSTLRKAIMNQSGWEVDEVAFISNFSFSQFVMWNDLKNRFDKLTENKVVRSLVDGRFTAYGDEEINPKSLDKDFKVSDLAIPSSIDSSQLMAVIEASKGNSFVLHGPPGTGKSQTITNMIANALYQGKSVLFVAEKMAALNVVAERLKKVGLGDFCGEIHSNKIQKSVVLEQLQRALSLKEEYDHTSYTRKSEQLQQLKEEVNGQLDELHRIRKQGYSLYQMITLCNQYPKEFRLFSFSDEQIENLTPTEWDHYTYLINQLSEVLKSLGEPIHNHPLKAFTKNTFSVTNQEEIKAILDRAISLVQQLETLAPSVLEGVSLEGKQLTYILMMGQLIRERNVKTQVTKDIWTTLLDPDVQQRLGAMSTLHRDFEVEKESLLQEFKGDILSLDIPSFTTALREARESFFLFRTKNVNRVLEELRQYYIGEAGMGTITNETVDVYVSKILNAKEKEGQVQKATDELMALFNGNIHTGLDAIDALEDLHVLITGIESIHEAHGESLDSLFNLLTTAQSVDWLHANKFIELEEIIDELSVELSKLESICGAVPSRDIHDTNGYTYIRKELESWLAHLDSWKTWSIFIHTLEELKEANLPQIGDALQKDSSIDSNQLRDYFKASLSYYVIRKFTSESSSLSNFNRIILEGKIDEYNRLIGELEKLSQDQIKHTLMTRIPQAKTCSDKEAAQLATIQRAIQSKGRGISIRDLFRHNGDVIRRLMPCMLMSPLSVAQYIDLDFPKFDLVIFDEASQIRTGTAIGAMSRAENCIIVGDPKQMPPTSFFSSTKLDEDNLDVEDLESLLEDCLAVNMPQRYLTCHYRSQSESLIAFSNKHFYENKMMTFPAPTDIVSKVRFEYQKGTYDRGVTRTNETEAIAIVKAIEERLEKGLTKESIGVITFNITQQELIDDKLQQLFDKKPNLKEAAASMYEEIFVKNLENVQGDERDIIFFSITYGPDEQGKVYQNYGPLGRVGGWRRLNVAASRARREMIIVSTLRSSDIAVSGRTSEGVKSLRNFLEFAEMGSRERTPEVEMTDSKTKDAKTTDTARDVSIKDMESSISNFLAEKGYQIKMQLGSSDFKIPLAIVDPHNSDQYLCGILIDDEEYAKLNTMRDRNALIPSVLERMGWKLYRIWSLDWFDNRKEEESRLLAFVEGLLEKP